MKREEYIKARPTKYVLEYGKNIGEIAKIFGTSVSTISEWNNDEKKRRWLKDRLKELEVKNVR